jgi:DNA-binding GntR family transcriptional regulator
VTDQSAPAGGSTWAASIGRTAAPLREQVVRVLRQAILDFELKPGQRLVERELIEQLQVSRTTVREVLRQLVAEGLVTVVPQKGAVVTAPSAEEAADIYDMRGIIEALVARRFVMRATPEQVIGLRKAFTAMEHALDNSFSIQQQLAAKDGFYAALTAGAHSTAIAQILSSLQARVRVLRATSLSLPGRPRQAITEIRQVVEAIEAGDADSAARYSELHVQNAARAATQVLNTRDGAGIADLAELSGTRGPQA